MRGPAAATSSSHRDQPPPARRRRPPRRRRRLVDVAQDQRSALGHHATSGRARPSNGSQDSLAASVDRACTRTPRDGRRSSAASIGAANSPRQRWRCAAAAGGRVRCGGRRCVNGSSALRRRGFERIGQQQHDHFVVLRERRPALLGNRGDAARVGQHHQARAGAQQARGVVERDRQAGIFLRRLRVPAHQRIQHAQRAARARGRRDRGLAQAATQRGDAVAIARRRPRRHRARARGLHRLEAHARAEVQRRRGVGDDQASGARVRPGTAWCGRARCARSGASRCGARRRRATYSRDSAYSMPRPRNGDSAWPLTP